MSGENGNDFVNTIFDISYRANAIHIKLSSGDNISSHILDILTTRINNSIINLDRETLEMLTNLPW